MLDRVALGAIGLIFTITGTFTIAFGDFVVLIGAGFGQYIF